MIGRFVVQSPANRVPAVLIGGAISLIRARYICASRINRRVGSGEYRVGMRLGWYDNCIVIASRINVDVHARINEVAARVR